MQYMEVYWKHKFVDEPSQIYCEVDEDRNEIRKIEIYNNGDFGYATKNLSCNGTLLSKSEIPDVGVINEDKQFVAKIISKITFEKMWNYVINK